jgi:hypothetical protein
MPTVLYRSILSSVKLSILRTLLALSGRSTGSTTLALSLLSQEVAARKLYEEAPRFSSSDR